MNARNIYNPIRTILVTAIIAVVLLFAGVYLALSFAPVQNKIRTQGEKALTEYLGTPVTIGEVTIEPFDQLTLKNVLIPDQQGDSMIVVDKLGAGVNLYDLIAKQKIVLTYAELVGLHGHITRPDKQSDTNLQFIIDKLKPKGDEPPKPFDLEIRNVVIRKCDIAYDVLAEPRRLDRFDPNHVHISNLRADVSLPRLKNDDFDIEVKRLSLDERSGFSLKNFASHVTITQQQLDVKDIQLELPHSSVNLGDIQLRYSALNQLGKELPGMTHQLNIGTSTITPSDFKAFVPQLQGLNDPMTLAANLQGNTDQVDVPMLIVHDQARNLDLKLSGSVAGLNDFQHLSFDLPQFQLRATRPVVDRLTALAPAMSPQVRDILARCETLGVDAAIQGNPGQIHFDGDVATALGNVALQGSLHNAPNGAKQFQGHVATPQFSLGRLIAKEPLLGNVALDAQVDAMLQGKSLNGNLDGHVDFIELKGNRYHDITANVTAEGNTYGGKVTINDPNGKITIEGSALLDGSNSRYDFVADASQVMLNHLGLTAKSPIDVVSLKAAGSFQGHRIDRANGSLEITDIALVKGDKTLNIDHISVDADNASSPQSIHLQSPNFEGHVDGSYDFATLVPSVKTMLSETFPMLFGAYSHTYRSQRPNDLSFSFVINPTDELQEFLNLPVKVLYKTTLEGQLDETGRGFDVRLNAPYLLQGSKNIIEQTSLNAHLDRETHRMMVDAHTIFPSKKGKIHIDLNAHGEGDSLASDLAWRVDRERTFAGNLNLSALLARNPDGKIRADINVNPSQLVFNDTAWLVQPGQITVDKDLVTVNNLAGQCDQQFVRINGRVSRNSDDVLLLKLNDVSLDYVFETLNIDNVTFGGRATGEFYASDLFSGAPRLLTPGLHVQNLAYNHAVMGDADIQSQWLNEERGVSLKATIHQKNGGESLVDGAIYIAADSLYLDFLTQRANIAFMKPFMKAFTSDVQGEASGHAVLLGNFHNINLYGDVLVDSLRFKLDYTNVYYTCSGDSVHMIPGLITFDDVRIHDRDGHEASMSGWLKHDCFHRPVFNFGITRAHDLLCYDTSAQDNSVWYGTVYGNGAAFVTGEPGIVNINVNMETAPRSRFTFVLSDSQQASEYNFITFHDRDNMGDNSQFSILNSQLTQDTIPALVRQLTAQAQKAEESEPTHYNIDLQGDITPDAQLVIVMDPVGGDQIKATGSGNLRMTYNDADEMTMFGKYVLDKGNYNFTLQDIIIKDFTIREGSSISFQGDPYAAQLDIAAVYSLTANIRDLDESFASDKEITRTNVPVHALLRARGLMSQPDISFDLEFPTLPSDAYRKVKSIISTDEMMNQQMVYLLALNRFYTPEYTGATTRSNELTSVASSTLSSQLSNILGKMSEKWSISPNFRSERGDFSDMEVDLALSSQLLNNRLLFNGNFGYRDNTYNQGSNFIGDFDIQYLLNSRGTLRLKAYNHFNDQNYYVRNALTTQGVGIVWKHDFNRLFDFRLRNKNSSPTKVGRAVGAPSAAENNSQSTHETDSTTVRPAKP